MAIGIRLPQRHERRFQKIAQAQILGWTVLQLTVDMVKNTRGIELTPHFFTSISEHYAATQ